MSLQTTGRVVAGIILVFGRLLVLSQSPIATPVVPQVFEVATVKLSDPTGAIGIRRFPGGRFITSNTSLRLLVTWAYEIGQERLVGAPVWLDSARFDIVAKSPDENPTLDELHVMVQSLLADRFKLTIHRERRELPLFMLKMDGSGSKVHALPPGTAINQDPFVMNQLGRLTGTHVTAAMLAKVLSNQLGKYVEDRTGFDPVFDFTLVWRPEGASPDDMPRRMTGCRGNAKCSAPDEWAG